MTNFRTTSGRPSERPSRRAEGRSAFSLIELVVVMTILAIAGTIGMSRLSSSSEQARLDAGMRRLMADLTSARRYARTISGPVQVDFDPAGRGYRMSTMPDPVTRKTGYNVNLGRAPYRLNLAMLDANADSDVIFTSMGTADADITLLLYTARHSRALRITAATGAIQELTVTEIKALEPELEGDAQAVVR